MIEDIAEKLAKQQNNKPWYFVIAFILIIAMSIPGIFMLVGNVEASLEKVLPPSVSSVDALNDARTQYSADMLHVVFYNQPPTTDIREADNYIQEIQQRIEAIPAVTATNHGQEDWHYNDDYTLSVLDIQADTGADTQRIAETIDAIQDAIDASAASNPGVRTQITGFAAIDKATFQTIMSDFLVITAIAMSLIALVVYLSFRNIKNVLLSIATVFAALLITMGATGYLNITVTVVTMVAAAMILGLGIDFAIHTNHTYNHQREHHKHKQALNNTLQELLRAQLGASLTTSAGFLALGLGVLPAMANLGLVLAMGVMSTLLAATLLLPSLLTLTKP